VDNTAVNTAAVRQKQTAEIQTRPMHYITLTTMDASTGFPQLRQNKIPSLFQITLKYLEAFCGAVYNSN